MKKMALILCVAFLATPSMAQRDTVRYGIGSFKAVIIQPNLDVGATLRALAPAGGTGVAYLRAQGDSVAVEVAHIQSGTASWATDAPHLGALSIINRGTYFTIKSSADEFIDSLKVTYKVYQ